MIYAGDKVASRANDPLRVLKDVLLVFTVSGVPGFKSKRPVEGTESLRSAKARKLSGRFKSKRPVEGTESERHCRAFGPNARSFKSKRPVEGTESSAAVNMQNRATVGFKSKRPVEGTERLCVCTDARRPLGASRANDPLRVLKDYLDSRSCSTMVLLQEQTTR